MYAHRQRHNGCTPWAIFFHPLWKHLQTQGSPSQEYYDRAHIEPIERHTQSENGCYKHRSYRDQWGRSPFYRFRSEPLSKVEHQYSGAHDVSVLQYKPPESRDSQLLRHEAVQKGASRQQAGDCRYGLQLSDQYSDYNEKFINKLAEVQAK